MGGLLAAMAYMLPVGRISGQGTATAAGWIVLVGLLVGLAWAGVFRLSWRIYGEAGGLRVIPALAIVVLECLFTGAFLVRGFSRSVAQASERHATPRLQRDDATNPGPTSCMDARPVETVALVLILTILAQWVLIVSIPVASPWWPTQGWRTHFNFLYPAPVYRPLILAPLWGRWGLLLACSIGRTAREADAETVALCRSVRPSVLLRWTLLPLVLSAIYFGRDGNYLIGIIAGMILFGVTYLAAVTFARRLGGQTRESLFAAAQIAQLTFLAVYRALWPLIHG